MGINMIHILKAFYFALHFVASFLGLIIMIHAPDLFWIGFSMFIFFMVKFFLMKDNII